MCEISVINPEPNDIQRLVDVCEAMYKRNNDGIGLVGVYPEGDSFRYTEYKSTEFDENAIAGFFGGNQDAWRVIAHCRLATAGGVSWDATHPIHVECNACDALKVIHNGIVTGHQPWMSSLEDEGHNFNTEVDTEVIAHALDDIPEEIENLDEENFGITGSLNFLVLGQDRILVRSGTKYQDRPGSFLMGRPVRCSWDGEKTKQWMLVHPDKEVQTAPASTQNRWSSRRSGGTSTAYGSGQSRRGVNRGNGSSSSVSDYTSDDSDDESDNEETAEEEVGESEEEDDPMEKVDWEEDWMNRYVDVDGLPGGNDGGDQEEEDEFDEIVNEHREEEEVEEPE